MPNVSAKPRSLQNGDIVREFVDTTSVSSTTYTYPVQQERLIIENSSDYDMYVTVGSYTDQLIQPDKSWDVDVTFTSFSIRSNVKSQEFVATAYQYDIEGGSSGGNTELTVQLNELSSAMAEIATLATKFGAVGNGTTNDSTAIQNAVNAARNILIPTGTYRIAQRVDIPANTHIVFAPGCTIVADQGISPFKALGDNVRFSGSGKIQGKTTATVDQYTAAISADSVSHLSVIGLTFENWGYGVNATGVKWLKVQHNHFNEIRQAAVYLYKQGAQTISDNLEPIISFNTLKTTIGNYSTGTAGKGIWVGALRAVIEGNIIDGGAVEAGGSATAPTGLRDGIWLDHCIDFNCTGNITRNFGDDGITVYRCTGGNITGNECLDSQSTYGIFLFGDSTEQTTKINVTGNKCRGNARSGIRALYANDCEIFDNTCENNGISALVASEPYLAGIFIQACNRIHTKGNVVRNNYNVGIILSTLTVNSVVTVCKDCEITDNVAHGNGTSSTWANRSGIRLEGDSTQFQPRVILKGNICFDNAIYGLSAQYLDEYRDDSGFYYNSDTTNRPQLENVHLVSVNRVHGHKVVCEYGKNYGFAASTSITEIILNECIANYNGDGNVTNGSGFLLLAPDVQQINCKAKSNYYSGTRITAGNRADVIGGEYKDNGTRGGVGTGYGLFLSGTFDRLTLKGFRAWDSGAAGNKAQKYGMTYNSPTLVEMSELDLLDNGQQGISAGSPVSTVKHRVKTLAGNREGTTALVSGTVTVSTTAIEFDSAIQLTVHSPSGTVGAHYVSARTIGTSFTITSTSAADNSQIRWRIV